MVDRVLELRQTPLTGADALRGRSGAAAEPEPSEDGCSRRSSRSRPGRFAARARNDNRGEMRPR